MAYLTLQEFPVAPTTLAATLRAIVGALEASDSSAAPERTFNFVRDFVCTQLNQADVNVFWSIERPVELLQELCAARRLGEPEPRLIGEAGMHTLLACYQVGIYSDRRLLATGFGENVDTAIELAARNALAKLFGTDTLRPLNFRISAQDCERLARSDAKQQLRQVA